MVIGLRGFGVYLLQNSISVSLYTCHYKAAAHRCSNCTDFSPMEGNVLGPARLQDAQNRRRRGAVRHIYDTDVKGWPQWFN